jgi:DNA-binding NarL/FixJ family response regulator
VLFPLPALRSALGHAILELVPLHCLIVDDNTSVLAAARDLLEREGISVVGLASTSADALDLVRELEPDVTLIDIELGDESGFDLADRLAELDHQVQTIPILISVHDRADFAELIEASPVAGFLSKGELSAQGIHSIIGEAPPR